MGVPYRVEPIFVHRGVESTYVCVEYLLVFGRLVIELRGVGPAPEKCLARIHWFHNFNAVNECFHFRVCALLLVVLALPDFHHRPAVLFQFFGSFDGAGICFGCCMNVVGSELASFHHAFRASVPVAAVKLIHGGAAHSVHFVWSYL